MKQRYRNISEEAQVHISKEHKLPLYITKIITEFPFKKLKELQRTGSFETLMLPSWGKYLVKQGMRARIKTLKETRKASILAKELNKKQQIDI